MNTDLLSRSGRSNRRHRWVPGTTLGPGRQIDSQDNRDSVSRLAGQTGTQDSRPYAPTNTPAGMGGQKHSPILPAESGVSVLAPPYLDAFMFCASLPGTPAFSRLQEPTLGTHPRRHRSDHFGRIGRLRRLLRAIEDMIHDHASDILCVDMAGRTNYLRCNPHNESPLNFGPIRPRNRQGYKHM